MDLNILKKKIDQLDFNLEKLLNDRMELSLRLSRMKQNADNPDSIPGGETHKWLGLPDRDFVAGIHKQIETETQKLKSTNPILAGFQGEHGAYGELAARTFNPDYAPIPCVEFVEIFDGVAAGYLDVGVVPSENPVEGTVTHVNDLLVERDLRIVGEINVPISHCLAALPDTDYREIRTVYSNPQTLAQCRGFLARNRLEARPYYDMAGAARMVSETKPVSAAAVASHLCASLYNLEIIKENIQDHQANYTRFVVISKEKLDLEGNKCSIIFSVKHQPGALSSVVGEFAGAGINIARIESWEPRNNPRQRSFLLEFQGSDKDPAITSVLEKTAEMVSFYKFLGCYMEAPL
ncbi:MAG: ACT domain-containing protein [Firmicutes bacterium]|nr:ACT domain-containing protein [Bacillota bacterium]